MNLATVSTKRWGPTWTANTATGNRKRHTGADVEPFYVSYLLLNLHFHLLVQTHLKQLLIHWPFHNYIMVTWVSFLGLVQWRTNMSCVQCGFEVYQPLFWLLIWLLPVELTSGGLLAADLCKIKKRQLEEPSRKLNQSQNKIRCYDKFRPNCC